MKAQDIVVGQSYGIMVTTGYRKPKALGTAKVLAEPENGWVEVEMPGRYPGRMERGHVSVQSLLTEKQVADRRRASESDAGGAARVAAQLRALGFKPDSTSGFRLRTNKKTAQISMTWTAMDRLLGMIPSETQGSALAGLLGEEV
jgi:hypothetical protein